MHNNLRLSHPDEYEMAKMLARFAVNKNGGEDGQINSEDCFRNLVVNRRPRRLPENHNFWHLLEGPLKMGELPSNVLDFDFHTSPAVIGEAGTAVRPSTIHASGLRSRSLNAPTHVSSEPVCIRFISLTIRRHARGGKKNKKKKKVSKHASRHVFNN